MLEKKGIHLSVNSSNTNKSRNGKDLRTAIVNIINMIIELKKIQIH